MTAKYVIDPDGAKCYGKYETSIKLAHIPDKELVKVDDLSQFDVINWRYEDW